MSISSTNRKAGPYAGNDVATAFPFSFKVFSASDLYVVRSDSTGAETELTLDTDYAVTLNANQDSNPGGAVTLPAALAAGYALVIASELESLQPVDLTNQGGFYPKVITNALDRLTILIQQLGESVSRSLKTAISTPSGVCTQLPAPVANSIIGWNSEANGFKNYPPSDNTLLSAALASSSGSTLVGFVQSGGGASASRTVQDKLREIVSVADWPNLSTALSSIGSSEVTLLVKTSVFVTSNITIPRNVSVRVEGAGVFVVTPGKRLIINGEFSAPKFHKCFDSSLLSTTLTASINGNALVVTSASQSVLDSGHVISGSGVLEGQMIQASYGNSSTGTYSLRDFNGVLTSRPMTAEGPSVIFGPGAVDCAYPQWWGGIADGNVTDNGPAIKQAIYSQRWGGHVRFPAGVYMVNAANAYIVIHAGLVLEGDAAADNGTGAPPNAYTTPSHIWLNGDYASLFIAGGTASHTHFKRLSIGGSQSVGGANLSPVGTGKNGVLYNGHAGQSIYGPVFEDCFFLNLNNGVFLLDSWAPAGDGYAPSGYYWNGQTIAATGMPTTGMGASYVYEIATVGTTDWGSLNATVISGSMGTVGCRFKLNSNSPAVTGSGTVSTMPTYYDWAIDPIIFRNCQFMANATGIKIMTSNADAVRLEDCVFILPANGLGVDLQRCGFIKLDTCFAFGGSNAGSVFVKLFGYGASSLDAVTLDNCQAELCANFLVYGASGTNDVPPVITVRNSNHQMGSDIYLGKPCDYISEGNQIQSFIYYDSPGIRIHSYNDKYVFQNFSNGPTWGPSFVSGDANTIYTYVPGKYPCSTITGAIIQGVPIFGLQGSGTPVGVVTPPFIGVDYYDYSGGHWWKSGGTVNTAWSQLS